MRSLSLLFISLSVIGNVLALESKSSSSDEELRLVHILFRHGARTPEFEAHTYPKDLYSNYTYHPYGFGQLTNLGKVEQYNLGKFIRKRYDLFLGKLYQSDTVLARSSNYDRTFMSCSLTLAGIWPPKGTELEWNPDLNWSPIPITSEPLHEDTLLIGNKNCPRYDEELEKVKKRPEVLEKYRDYKKIVDEMKNITGADLSVFYDLNILYTIIRSQDLLGLQLPDNIRKYYPEKLDKLAVYYYELEVYNDILKRLKMGSLLKEIFGHWTNKTENVLNPVNRKLFLYGGHDLTLVYFLRSIGAWKTHYPDYSEAVILELHENIKTKTYGVRIYSKARTDADVKPLVIEGCQEFCPLDKLKELIKHLIITDRDSECKL